VNAAFFGLALTAALTPKLLGAIVSTEDLGRRLHGTADPATSQEHDH
jgi:hypothetical protein